MILAAPSRLIPFIIVLVVMAGCDNETKERIGGASGGSASDAEDGSVQDVTEAFAKALNTADYPAAYALTSSHIKSKMSAAEFTKFHTDARAKYGKPLKHEVSQGNDDLDEIKGEDYDTGIPSQDRVAWMHIMWVLETDDTGDVDRCYETWLMITKEEGQNKIGSMEYTWCD